ncbi:hypothetical protein C8Q74DRAFT_1217768 [Fomes fomentarius]|nr:hypothetical protein C8Q74DRAFT_1217768 [Fomes fomentarius]
MTASLRGPSCIVAADMCRHYYHKMALAYSDPSFSKGLAYANIPCQTVARIFCQICPENIPGGTSVPAWAYQDVKVNSTWNTETAKATAGQTKPLLTSFVRPQTDVLYSGLPDKTASASSTSGAPNSSGTPAPGSEDGGDESTGSGNEKKSSNIGLIVGGVIGGNTGAVVIAFGILRHWLTLGLVTLGLEVATPPGSPAAHSTVYGPNAALANAPAGSSSGSGQGGWVGV